MADAQPASKSSARGPRLPALERLAPPPDPVVLANLVAAGSRPGEVVLELHSRGGWVTRSAIDQLRRGFTIETSALTRLVADVVLRPPDLRHLDAAVSGIAVDTRGMEGGLRQVVEALYMSRCPSCGGTVVVDEFIWDAEASDPSRKSYRCPRCREARNEGRTVPVDPDDLYRARSIDASVARAALRERFPAPTGDHPLPDALVDLYPPRAQLAVAAILERIETETRPPSIQAALRLAIVGMALSVSRLNGYPGRVAQVRIANGQLKSPSARQWRERNVWAAFDEATRIVRSFVQALDTGTARTPARVGPDLRALVDGSANVALRFGMPYGRETFGPPPRPGDAPGPRPRVRPGIGLVLTQPPIHWSPENVAFAYLASSLAIGPEGAASLPLATIFGPSGRAGWARDAAALERSLSAIEDVLLPEARVVIVLRDAGPEELVAAVIGGVAGGLRVDDAVLGTSEAGISGSLHLAQPQSNAGPGRDVALRSSEGAGPLHLSAVEAAIADISVAVMQLRGEPTRFDRILGEVLLGLDHLGYLRRLVGTRRSAREDIDEGGRREVGLFGVVTEAPGTAAAPEGVERDMEDASQEDGDRGRDDEGPEDAGSDGRDGEGVEADARDADIEGRPSGGSVAWDDPGPASDPVRLTLELIRKELRRPEHPRLLGLEPDLWWLRDERDIRAAKEPLSERVEWGIFSLLTTSGGISRSSFDERVSRLFRGPETADAELVEACLESYRSPDSAADGLIHTNESLQRRYAEHGEVVGLLTEFGHRLGMRAWVSRREQRRTYRGAPLRDLLSDPEQRVYLPLVAPGPQELLEDIDCIWYVRGRGAFLFDVEWMAALDEPVLRRGPAIRSGDEVVRFLVVADERAPLVRLRLARSPLLRGQLEQDNWHILKWSSVRRLHAGKRADLAALGPLLGLDPEVERGEDQMALFSR